MTGETKHKVLNGVITPKQKRFAALYLEYYLSGQKTLKECYKEAGYRCGSPYAALHTDGVQCLIKEAAKEDLRRTWGGKDCLISDLYGLYEDARNEVILESYDENGELKTEFNGTAAANCLNIIKQISAMQGYDAPQKQEQKVHFDLGGVTAEDIDRWTKA